jgi:hypothetical protein
VISIDKYEGVNCIQIYPKEGVYTPTTLRFTDKQNNAAERQLYSNYWREQIDMFGQKVLYFRNLYNVLSANNTYGEHTLQSFEAPKELIMAVNLSENALVLSKFGFQSDDAITAFVHISTFYAVYPLDIEPKAGDVFKLVEYGSDRPGERDGKLFEVTERIDEDNSKINPLMGHYVWMIKAKRFDYSWEPGLEQGIEKGSDQVHDDTFYGTLTGAVPAQREPDYPGDANTESKEKVFNMNINDTLTYGGYY